VQDLKSNKGFSFIEIMVAASLLTMLAVLFIPIGTTIRMERQVLKDKRIFALSLHDELLHFLTESPEPQLYKRKTNGKILTFQFKQEHAYWKGCASWKNAKHKEETLCLYGIPQK